MLYYSYLEFVNERYGMFKITFKIYQEYRDFCLENDFLFFGRNNEHSESYYYRKLIEHLALNHYV